jgi:hypothetical protein
VQPEIAISWPNVTIFSDQIIENWQVRTHFGKSAFRLLVKTSKKKAAHACSGAAWKKRSP